MSDSKYKAYLWKQHREYYREDQGEILFNEDTPQEILESYELWKKQLQKLNEFPTERKSGLFSIFEKSDKKAIQPQSANCVSKAKEFIRIQCSSRNFNMADVSSDLVFIGFDKSLYTSLANIKRYIGKPLFHETLKKQDKVIVMWSLEESDMITVFWFRDQIKIYRVQEYICTKSSS